jgi:ribosomal protein S18 acetylase RimI-like enzyme
MSHAFTIEPAQAEEFVPALRLVFQHLPAAERTGRVANALTLICQGELDPQGILVAREGSALRAAIVAIPLPGAGGIVWPPGMERPGPRDALEDALVRSALNRLRAGGAKVAQAIIRPEDHVLAEPLVRGGFRHITDLCYLRHPLCAGPPPTAFVPQILSLQAYGLADGLLFEQILLRTYEGTLDCPELNGLRTAEEILAGHRAQGNHDPALWWLAFRSGAPVGVLLLTAMPEWDSLDIAYLGVVPEARRQGIGKQLALHALHEARAREVVQVTLAVDERNRAAMEMYRRLGFIRHERREVYLRIWDVHSDPP